MNSISLDLNEAFISIQGEGKTTGRRSLFLRTSGCNLNCKGCDTFHNTINLQMTAKNIQQVCYKNNVYNVIFTGGEPMLQQDSIALIISEIMKDSDEYTFEIETNGTIAPKYKELEKNINQWNISPKISPMIVNVWKTSYSLLYQLKNLSSYIIKIPFVVSESNNLTLNSFIISYNLDKSNIWLMPYSRDKEEYFIEAESVWNYCIQNGYNFSTRLQLLHSDNKELVDIGKKV